MRAESKWGGFWHRGTPGADSGERGYGWDAAGAGRLWETTMKHCDRARRWIRIVLLTLAGVPAVAGAQDSGLGLSLGLKVWRTQWTTFSYANNGTVLTQAPADDKAVTIPVLGLRWRDFTASLSGYGSTNFQLQDGPVNSRREFDLNLGYAVSPGVAVTLGYKKYRQQGERIYELAGPTLGLSATAPLAGAFSMYGTLGLGRMKDTPASNVYFDAGYQLSEVGFAYNLGTGSWPRALLFTFGYRMQVLISKDALGTQDARDLTQGFALGVIAVF